MAAPRLTESQRATLLRCPEDRMFTAGEVGCAQQHVLDFFKRHGWVERLDAGTQGRPPRNGLRWRYRLTEAGRAVQAAERQG